MIEKWFVDYRQVIEERGIHPDDIHTSTKQAFKWRREGSVDYYKRAKEGVIQ
jgi:hypothetical protein